MLLYALTSTAASGGETVAIDSGDNVTYNTTEVFMQLFEMRSSVELCGLLTQN